MSSNTSNKRISFASTKNQLQYPDFLEVQLKSFKDFFQLGTTPENRKNEGLYTVFKENFPITDTRNNFVLEFLDYFIDPPRYTIDECLEQGLTYGAPLKAKLKLYCTDPEHEDFDTVIEDVYLGNVPYMTPKGTFVINGAERVIVSQLHRSPGVFFGQSVHANGTKLYSARIIPFKGSWIEFATDINNVKKLLFYNPTAAGINKPTANNAELSLVVDDDQVSLKGWTAGNIARAVIYSTSGQAFYNEANWDGSAISISSLPKGVYILTVNNNSYKFRK